jgi:hypothetical protein
LSSEADLEKGARETEGEEQQQEKMEQSLQKTCRGRPSHQDRKREGKEEGWVEEAQGNNNDVFQSLSSQVFLMSIVIKLTCHKYPFES